MTYTIQTLAANPELETRRQLATLLIDAVTSGASIGFLPPLAPQEADAYWQQVLSDVAQGSRLLWIASVDGMIVGSVQLDLCMRANGLHRAEIAKLIVHREQRRQGIGRALMGALEQAALATGRTTLVLDTRQGDPSEALYTALGYQPSGVIPQYARSANGQLHATAFYYKVLV
ncbi:MAG: GNAT family N-acetyltransferase [Caldilineaceae bacterium]|nr:GNAT family N-acetyltransferase [Caldilineaceae bacterium]